MSFWKTLLKLGAKWIAENGSSPGSNAPPTPEPASTSGLHFNHEAIWKGSPYKLVGLLGTTHGWFATTSNVYRGDHKSRIFLNGKQIHEAAVETIGQPFEHDGAVYFPVEHGTHCLVYKDGRIRNAAQIAGKWSVTGFVHRGRPLVAYNNKYGSGRSFEDRPVLCDARTGEQVFELPIKAMPRDAAEHKGEVYIPCNFGENATVCLSSGKKIPGDIVHVASNGIDLYGGGGAAWGPSGDSSDANGRIYVLEGGAWKEIFNTGCCSIQCMVAHDGIIYAAGADPDRLFMIDQAGQVKQLCEVLGEAASDRARSFGAAVTKDNGRLLFGRSSRDAPLVYELTGAAAPALKKTYRGVLGVGAASGALASAAQDAEFEVELSVSGSEEDFALPNGKTFLVSGRIIEAMNDKAENIMRLAGENSVSFENEAVTGAIYSGEAGHTLHVEREDTKTMILINASIDQEWEKISGIEIKVDVLGAAGLLVIDNVRIIGRMEEA